MSETIRALELVESLIATRMAALHKAARDAASTPRAQYSANSRANELGILKAEIRKARESLAADPAGPAAP